MEIRQIMYVLETARQGNFSRAAQALYVSQPAVSSQIRALEEELGVVLFDRDTHSVSLTQEGLLFCKYGEAIIKDVNALMAAFDQRTSEKKAMLNVGVFPFYRLTGLSQLLTSFYRQHVNVIGSIRAVDNFQAYELLDAGKMDYAILKLRHADKLPRFQYDVLRREPVEVVLNRRHPLAGKASLTYADLDGLPLLTGETDSYYYKGMKEHFLQEGAAFNVAFHNTLDVDLMIDMLHEGRGYTFATRDVAVAVADDSISAVPLVPTDIFDICLVYPARKRPVGIYKTFVEYVSDCYRKDHEVQ